MQSRPSASPKLPAGYRLLRLESVDSTNAEAQRRAEAGETGPLWVWSLRQSAGRGRVGRSWQSHKGNLFASLLLSLSCPLAVASQLGLLAGLAAYDAIAELLGKGEAGEAAELTLKWPNDVLLRRKKLAGVLIENARALDQTHCTVVIGTGINLAHHPDGLEQPATSLAAEGASVDPAEALGILAAATELWLKRWGEGAAFQAVRRAWLDRAGPLGAAISVKLPNETLQGAFGGLDASGALRLRLESGIERRIAAGDVFFPSQ
jgi:BirA family transcriptional regulator, biotin operon repressor / biotin---[acetyl-CoA-carboxylase] ligase